MTRVTLADDGPNVSGQPSKTSGEYQELLAADIPNVPATPQDPAERFRVAGVAIQASIERIQFNPSPPRSLHQDSRPVPQNSPPVIVADPMHTLLEGLTRYHRKIMLLDELSARLPEPSPAHTIYKMLGISSNL
jgi:hypothetical protein